MLTCRFYQAQIAAYVDGTLTPKARRRMAAHLERCETCYVLYARQRDLHNELRRMIPLVGQRAASDFTRTWRAIRDELPYAHQRRYQARYGLVALSLMMILALPFTMGHRDLPMTLPLHPIPATYNLSTPASTEPVAVVTLTASETASSISTETAPLLPTVPEPDVIRGLNGNDD